ncbi:MAG: hypothetical protein DI598_20245, partial [Pseudopedobacter saltans]
GIFSYQIKIHSADCRIFITCVGYLIDFVLLFLFSSLRITISDFTWIGEVIMVLWLLTVGVKTNEFLKYF